MEIININTNDAGKRIDSFLKRLMPAAPQSLIYRYLRTNKIKLNGKKPAPDVRLCEKDVITYYGDSELICVKKFTPSPYTLDILYEDDNIIMINKPVHLACQPDNMRQHGTLVDFVKSYLFEKGEYCPEKEQSFAPALCNRIDLNTSGLCIAAKNAAALRDINERLRTREIRRFYICQAEGVPPETEGVIKGFLKKDTALNKSTVSNEGVYAETHYKLLETYDTYSLLELEIITGRSHQIRVHLSSIGCPIIGDLKYGNGGKGQRLTAHKMIFAFPPYDGVLSYLSDREFVLPYEKCNLR